MKQKNSGTEHRIRSFQDINLIITEQNVDMIIGNMYAVFKTFLEQRKIHKGLELKGFNWIDDGQINITGIEYNEDSKIFREMFQGVTPETKFFDAKISTRLYMSGRRIAENLDIKFTDFKISDLTTLSEYDYTKVRNLGKKTLLELKTLVNCAGLALKP